jgi:hypothetical protein
METGASGAIGRPKPRGEKNKTQAATSQGPGLVVAKKDQGEITLRF